MPKRCSKNTEKRLRLRPQNMQNQARGPPDPMPDVFRSIFAFERLYNDFHGFSVYGGPLKTTNPLKTPCRSRIKKASKNDTQKSRKLVPKWGPKMTKNHQKRCLGVTSAQGWLLNRFQAPSEIDFGELLRRFLKHFRQMFEPKGAGGSGRSP